MADREARRLALLDDARAWPRDMGEGALINQLADEVERLRAEVANAKAEALAEADTVFEGREFNGFQYVPRTMRQVRRVIREKAAHYRGQETL